MPAQHTTLLALALTALSLIAAPGTSQVSTPPPAPEARSLQGVTSSAVTAGTTYTDARGSSYAVSTVVGGQPVRWNPCTPIHWRSNTVRAPQNGLALLKQSVAEVAAATGTRWVYDGPSTAIPSTTALPASPSTPRPVLIGWSDPTTSNLLRGQPANVLAMTRTAWFGEVRASETVAATRGAVVALDRTDWLPLTGVLSWQSVLRHELGHVMGLAHPRDSGELMHATISTRFGGWQQGDRRGLQLLGASSGCTRF